MSKKGKARTRKIRRTAKKVLKYGPSAKRPHMRVGGRTGSVSHKRMKSLLAALEITQ